MRLAVIGGGASGLAAAWCLDAAHDVHLYEREPMLGGHIRTLGGNVACAALPPGVRLDAGVIEFDRADFPAFHAWMHALGVDVRPIPTAGSSNLFRADGRHYHSPGALLAEHPHLHERLGEWAHLVPLMLRLRRFRMEAAHAQEHDGGTVDRFLSSDDFSVWVRSLLMYAYSTHYDEVGQLSAAMAIPMLRSFLDSKEWTHIPGGVSTYIDAVARSLRGSVHLAARIEAVRRDANGVTLRHVDGDEARFDALVLAVPPHRILPLLADADPIEHLWFDACEGHTVHTVAHCDPGPYLRRGIRVPTEFDLFELENGGHGYNAYLNRLADLPEHTGLQYGLAFDLDAELDPARILHRQPHDVALYTVHALARRAEVRAENGHRRTWYVGAWLGDGLHEGAVRSALAVSERLGGRTLGEFSAQP